MSKQLIVIAVIIVIVVFASGTILGQFSSVRLIGSRGEVKVVDVGVYWDANCTSSSSVDYVDWGSLAPGLVRNVTVFIRNEGNEPSTLFLNTTNWNPSNASDYITLNWDYNGYIIPQKETTEVTLTLSVASTIEEVKDFSFDIIIGVNEQA